MRRFVETNRGEAVGGDFRALAELSTESKCCCCGANPSQLPKTIILGHI